MPDWISLLVVAIIAAIPGVYAIIAGRKVNEATAASKITEAAAKLIDDFRNQVVALQRHASDQALQIAKLSETLSTAMYRIRELEFENEQLKSANRELREKLDALREEREGE